MGMRKKRAETCKHKNPSISKTAHTYQVQMCPHCLCERTRDIKLVTKVVPQSEWSDWEHYDGTPAKQKGGDK